jgi:peroxiredoxin
MQNNMLLWVLGIVMATVLPAQAIAGSSLTVDAAVLGGLKLPAPQDEAMRRYLGLSPGDVFTLSDIKADTVVLQVFSMYCPLCQADAVNVNRLYDMIQKDSSLKNKLRLIGVGTGNTAFEVDVFRKKFSIPFPLFPDEEFQVQKASSETIRTPVFVVLQRGRDKALKVVEVHVGQLHEPGPYLKNLRRLVGRK